MSNIYEGVHVGIVVQNDDPNFGGRVKVFVPEHSPNIDKLNKYIREGKEIKFNAIDHDISPELVEILDDLKEALPWAEYAGPIFGGSSDGRFRCCMSLTSLNDDENFGKYGSINGFREANKFVGNRTPKDAFGISNGNTIDISNENATSYEPANYSGMPRGLFSIPNVGAQVYVMYINNDPAYPIYFAAAYNPDSIKKIYTLGQRSDDPTREFKLYDYPNDFENSDEETEDSKVFRSKTVLNSNKHTIEMIDTDGSESLRLQHYGGGFTQFTNYGVKMFTPGNDQSLVYGNKFSTVKGDTGTSIGGDSIEIIHGNSHETVGDYNDVRENAIPVIDALNELGNIKRLFNVRRTTTAFPPQDVSTLQTMKASGGGKGYVTCPTCGGKTYDPYNVNGLNVGGTYFNEQTDEEEQRIFRKTHVISMDDSGNTTNEESVEGFITSKNKIKEDIEYGWSRIPKAKYFCNNEFITPPPYFSKEYLEGVSTENESEDVTAESVTRLEKSLSEKHEQHEGYGKVGIFGGIMCPTCNNQLWIKSDQTKAWAPNERNGLSGYSPSTENGHWARETKLQSELGIKIENKFRSLSENLAAIGEGGDRVETITMSKVETIGTIFNDVPSFRVDPIGKLRLDGLFVTQQSTVPYYLPTPHVEPVDVTSVPGGDYNLTIGNKWNVNVGSQGISIKTTGGIQIGGAISTIATQELNLSAKHDMMIDGGERLTIRARKVTVNPVEHNALSVDGQLHVLRNMIVRGGALIEGEVALQHVTAPGELVLTGPEIWMGSEEEACAVSAVMTIGAELATMDEDVPTRSSHVHSILVGGAVGSTLGQLAHGLDYVSGFTHKITGGLFGSSHHKNRTQDKRIDSLESSISAIIAFLSGEIPITLLLPYHEHTFLQIPTTFKDCPNGVRAELLGSENNINSRQIIVAAKRRHHVGAMEECDDAKEVYNKNKEFFDKKIWSVISNDVIGLKENMTEKGLKEGVNPNQALNPMTYALLCYSGCSGNLATLYFYTIRAYYKQATNQADLLFGKMMSNSTICRLKFELARESDDTSMGDTDNSHSTSVTVTNHYSEEDLARGFVSGTEVVGLVGGSIGGAQVNANKEQNDTMLSTWVTKFTAMV